MGPINVAGAVRVVVAALYCAAGLFVYFHLATKYHWGGVSVRLPILAVVPWAYSNKWKNGLVAGLCLVSVVAIGAAFVVDVLPGLARALPGLTETVLGAAGLAALVCAGVAHAWLFYWGWRADRERLRTKYPSPLERASGGF